jgi:hypothetical protein
LLALVATVFIAYLTGQATKTTQKAGISQKSLLFYFSHKHRFTFHKPL